MSPTTIASIVVTAVASFACGYWCGMINTETEGAADDRRARQ